MALFLMWALWGGLAQENPLEPLPPFAEACVRADTPVSPAGEGRLEERLREGRRLLAENRPEEAVAALECAARLVPDHAGTRGVLGSAYFRAGRWLDALGQYERSLDLDPESEMVRLQMAEVFLEAGLGEEAHRTLDAGAAMFPDSDRPEYNEFYFRLAELYADRGRLGSAREAMEAAAGREGPVEPVLIYQKLGDFSADLLELESAHLAYTHALALSPDHVPSRLALARLHLRQGRLDDALEAYLGVLRRNPDAAEARYGIAEVHFRAGRLAEAVEEARQAVALAPEAPAPRYVLGRALQLIGEADAGRQELGEYGRLQAEVLVADHREREIHAYQSEAIVLLYRGHAAAAATRLEEGIAAYPDATDLYFSLGLVQSQSGRHADAVRTYTQLLELSPEAADSIRAHLAREQPLAVIETGDTGAPVAAPGTDAPAAPPAP